MSCFSDKPTLASTCRIFCQRQSHPGRESLRRVWPLHTSACSPTQSMAPVLEAAGPPLCGPASTCHLAPRMQESSDTKEITIFSAVHATSPIRPKKNISILQFFQTQMSDPRPGRFRVLHCQFHPLPKLGATRAVERT